MFYGLDRCLLRLTTKTDYANQKTESTGGKVRREFLKDLVSLPVFGGFLYGLFRKRQWESFDELHLISQPSRIDAATGASPVGSGFASLSDLENQKPGNQSSYMWWESNQWLCPFKRFNLCLTSAPKLF